ncbi:unnamed protein product [Arabidopsis thaliana]|uniref:RNI-like superfamily protein n=1 Tax=Arabidopsis thaliana TaxID=3702 RepID=A0A5S9XRG0_ARATH|nr:unnamed protein product [Arabidopsis thaliana]
MASSSSLSSTPLPSLMKDEMCKPWHRVCKDPSMWRKIDIDNRNDRAAFKYDLESMCRHAVDRSHGGLIEIEIWYYGTNDLIMYIADRSSNLKSLGLVRCFPITDEGVAKAVSKVPLLEYLETLKLNRAPEIMFSNSGFDDNAKAIAESMPELRHLQLLGNGLTNKGLNAILDGCPHLEHLDLRQCFNINLVGDLKKRCFERIKDLRCPNDSDDDSDGDYNQGAVTTFGSQYNEADYHWY